MKRFAAGLLCLSLCALAGGGFPSVQAQGPPAETPPVATSGGATTTSGAPAVRRDANALPPPPNGFYRGNNDKSTAYAGFYLNLVSFVLVGGWFFLWVWSTHWVSKDVLMLKMPQYLWNSLVFGVGVAGFLFAFLMPSFIVGFLWLGLTYGVPLGVYIKLRNDRVPESGKVMTPRHIQGVLIRLANRLGIPLGKGGAVESAIGPPIRFLGKTRTGKGGMDGSVNKQVEKSRGYLAAKELVYDAILRRSTDIHLEPNDSELQVRYRIDGVLYPTEPFDRGVGDAIINIFKVLSAMDITEKRKAQDGSFRAELDDREIDFRVATQGTGDGEKMSIRILDQSGSVSTMAQLGMRKQLQDQITGIIEQPHGLFLVCGPTGAGKSTTLYACLGELDAHQQNIITVEDPIEYRMKLVTQIEINTKGGQTFASALRSILRQDPDVVLIGEMRDDETAKIACQAANTGHMVFSTVHANDSIAALFRIIDLGVEPFMLSTSLSGILAQRLCRRLCEDCKETFKPTPDFLKKNGLPTEKIDTLYRPPKGENACPTCGGLGYKGRIGVFELLNINDRLRDLIRDNPNLSQIKAEARKNGMLYMREEGLRLVVKGMTSIEELGRVVK